jgi:hypothetical protein
MKKSTYVFLALLLSAFTVQAQSTKKLRYVNHTEFGGLFGRVKFGGEINGNQEQVENKTNLTVQMFNGVEVTNSLATGVTVGMDWYAAALLTPIAAGVRYDFTKQGRVRLFGTLDAGYGFAWLQQDVEGYDTRGGLMLNPGIGLRFGKAGGTGFTLAFTYKRQEAQVEKPPLWGQTKRSEDRVYNRLALRLGLSF